MADILISKFTTQIPRVGATPATPGFAESEGQDPVAPSGTPQVYTPVTIGSPANGLSIDASQVLSLGLASTSATGALSNTDWNTFNNKLNLTSPINGYTVGANTALADTDTILQAFGKVQGQINARISGSGTTNYLSKFTGSGTIGDSAVFESGGNILIGTTSDSGQRLQVTGDGYFSGNVGIGTTNPSQKLTIVESNNSLFDVLGVYNGVTATEALGKGTAIRIGYNSSGEYSTKIATVYEGSNPGFLNPALAFYTMFNTFLKDSEVERMRISSNGNVGIGTSTPSYKVDTLVNTNGIDGYNVFGSNGGGSEQFGYRAINANSVGFFAGVNGAFYSGSFGSANEALLTSIGGVSLVIGTNSTERMRITSSGNLLVGTTSDSGHKLNVNGEARIQTINNLGVSATSVLVPSATGVISLRTLAELTIDAGLVTLAETQTITGAKTFNNSLLVQSGSNPVFRIATTDNTAIVNFRNAINEDAAGIEMSGPSNELAIVTRVSNYNIRIQPHGTGTIKLPNVPTGTGDVLGRDSSNNLVRLGSSVVESTGTFTPTLTASGGGITYTFTTTNASYVKVGSLVYFSVTLSSISSTGSGVNELLLGSLPFNSATGTGKFWYIGITTITGSSYSKDALFDLRGIIAPNDNKVSFNGIWSTWTAPTFTSGTISISGVYSTI